MNSGWLQERLQLGEDSRTEFKGVAAAQFDIDADILAREVAAFANSGGGYLVLGVEDDGIVSGTGTIEQTDKLMQKAVNVCLDRNLPHCSFSKALMGENRVLVIEVPGFTPARPYLVGGRLYVRHGSETRAGTREDLVRITQSVDYHFDEQPVVGSTSEDLDDRVAGRFFQDAFGRTADFAEAARLLRELRCLTSNHVPTVAGLLFFGRDPQKWLPDARISAAQFPGTETTSEFLDRQEIGGTLPEQLRAVTDFLSRHLSSPSRVEGWERREQAIPTGALREALLNALMHRDYRMEAQTRVLVFSDRVEVANPGGLLNQLSLESIKLGISQRRNPRLASLLSSVIGRESLGVGIPDMLRLMAEHHLPEPAFSLEAGHFRVVLQSA